MDFEAILNIEYSNMVHGPNMSKAMFQRVLEHKMEPFLGSEKHKKLSSIYYPVDKSQLNRCGGHLPYLLRDSFI
jgi:hypothetical protein